MALAGILFFWQITHTLAIGHLYRQDYARAGMRILPVLDEDGVSTSLQAFNNCLALLPVGLLPPDRVEWHRLPCCVDRACTRVSVDRGEIRPR